MSSVRGRLDPRWRRAVLVFLAILANGGWPNDDLRARFARVYCEVANVMWFEGRRYGETGYARMAPVGPESASTRPRGGTGGNHVREDARLHLSVLMVRGNASVGVSVRRDVYWPLVSCMALLLAAP